MTERREYTESFRQQALEKVYTRGNNSIRVVAEDLNMSLGTLRNWMKAVRDRSRAKTGMQSKRPQDWSLAERLLNGRHLLTLNEPGHEQLTAFV